MGLFAHKAIDALRDSKRYKLYDVLGHLKHERKRTAASMIVEAQKFDFGSLHLEKLSEEEGTWAIPAMTTEEMEWWRDGLIPLPFPICWYEFVINGWRSGLLVYQPSDQPDKWYVERIEYIHTDDEIMYDGLISRVELVPGKKELPVDVIGNDEALEELGKPKLKKFLNSNLLANIPLAIYLTLMLNSKSTEVRRAEVSTALRKSQMKKGRTPLPDHRIVTIVPQRFRDVDEPGHQGGTHRAPRLHWRRSHQRHYKNSKVVVPKQADPAQAIREALAQREGTAAKPTAWVELQAGETTTTYMVDYTVVIARMLVGRADLGEVSHEYRIPAPEKEPA